MVRLITILFASITAFLLPASFASAATPVTRIVDFTFSDFAAQDASLAAPFQTVTGSFTATFDPTEDFVGPITDFTSNLSPQYVSGLKFGYSAYSGFFSFGQLVTPHSVGYHQPGQSVGFGAYFELKPIDLTPTDGGLMIYTTPIAQFSGNLTSLTLTDPAASAVPEPASWAFLLTGFFLIGGAMRGTRARGGKLATI